MTQFFEKIAEILLDKQELQINITKSERETLMVVTIPNTKIGGNITMTGTVEDFDKEYIDSLKAKLEEKPKFIVMDIEPEAKEEEEEEGKGKTESTPKKEKKVIAKKESAKTTKAEAKKEEAKSEEKPEEQQPKSDNKEEDAKNENKKTLFTNLMTKGASLEKLLKWDEAKTTYADAAVYFPEDKTLIEAQQRVEKWIKAKQELDL